MIIPKAMLKHADHYKPILKLNNIAQGRKVDNNTNVKVFQQKDTAAQDTVKDVEPQEFEEAEKQVEADKAQREAELEAKRQQEDEKAMKAAYEQEINDAKQINNKSAEELKPQYIGNEE